jgi:hypothetical protein
MEGLEAHRRSWEDNQGTEKTVIVSHGAFLIITLARHNHAVIGKSVFSWKEPRTCLQLAGATLITLQ